MPELHGTQTHEHLRNVFAREAQSAYRFLYYARIAEIEGYADAASVLRAMAEAQAGYVHGHMDFLKRAGDPLSGLPVGETAHNLAAAESSEADDATEIYPEMARTAHAEGFPDVASWFETLARVKERHGARVREALDGMGSG